MSVAEYEIYKRIKLLGEGSFGKAYLVECLKDQSLCVIKQVDLNNMPESEKRDTLKEAKILESLKHPNIIKFREVYKTRRGKLCIVMDYADGGDLAKKLQDAKGSYIPESQILDWFTQICLALKHAHDRKIIHRDLKCQNIFLTKSGIIKLGDFGIAKVLGATRENAKSRVGTPYYLSPEIVENVPYSFKSDIWSLGVILYELCSLKPPFDGANITQLAIKIVRGIYNPIPSQYSKELKNLVSIMLARDPNKRPNINQILKTPVITNRIKSVLSESVRLQEFSHTILHNKKIDPWINLGEIKNVLNEAPIPAEMLKRQLQQEKLEKDKQEKLEKEKLEREKYEKEKAERDKLERERERIEREKEKEKIIHYKNIINLPSHRDVSPISNWNQNPINLNLNNGVPGVNLPSHRDVSPLARNYVSPNTNNILNNGIITENLTPKINQKIDFINPSPINKNNMIGQPFSANANAKPVLHIPALQPQLNNNNGHSKPNLLNQGDQFSKREPIQVSGLKSPNCIDKNNGIVKLVDSIKYPEPESNKPYQKYNEIERGKPESKFIFCGEIDTKDPIAIRPTISPKNLDLNRQAKDRPDIKRYLTPMNNQRNNDDRHCLPDLNKEIGLNKIIEEEPDRREISKKKSQKVKTEEEKAKLLFELERKEKKAKRQVERNEMRLSISLKRQALKIDENQIEIEWFIPKYPNEKQNINNIDNNSNKMNREATTASNTNTNNIKEDNKLLKKSDNKENMPDENYIEILNEMQKIVEATGVEEQNLKVDETISEELDTMMNNVVEDREDDCDDPKEVGQTLKDISNIRQDHPYSSVGYLDDVNKGLKPLLEENLGIDKYKKAQNCVGKLLNKYLTDIHISTENPYDEFQKELGDILKKETTNQYLPLLLMHAIQFDDL